MGTDILVTGVGLVTPVGIARERTWAALKAGESGADTVSGFDPAERSLRSRIACQVEDDCAGHRRVDPRSMGRHQRFAMVAADEALADAGLVPSSEEWTPERVGVALGTGLGGARAQETATRDLASGDRPSPRLLLRVLPNLGAGHLSAAFDARGPNRAPATACAAGGHAIEAAARDIRAGRADAMLAGGAEAAVSPDLMAAFDAMRALSTRNDDPGAAMRPFDADRDGFVIAEGAAVLLLEAADHAAARGATPYATLAGWGAAGDAAHPTRPPDDARGLVRAMREALAVAGTPPGTVDCVSAHATSTPAGDAHESTAIAAVFDDPPAVWAPKSALGHALGAAGAIEAALAALAIDSGVVPGTLNLDRRDEDCRVPVLAETRAIEPATVVSNAAGFGGTNSSLVVTAPDT
jgi:3-oxoacyl-[acyl-carrier-protein] synthase II